MSVLTVKDPEDYGLVSALSQATGKSLTRTVFDVLRAESHRVC